MTTYFVSRHDGANNWARQEVPEARQVSHLDVGNVGPGDIVIGNLPVHLAAAVCARGARFRHFAFDTVPASAARSCPARP